MGDKIYELEKNLLKYHKSFEENTKNFDVEYNIKDDLAFEDLLKSFNKMDRGIGEDDDDEAIYNSPVVERKDYITAYYNQSNNTTKLG